MSKIITFSQYFPFNHPKRGKPTLFVNKILSGEKVHTIRRGQRWQPNQFFSPRVWSGKPYASKQIILAPDIEIKKVYDFEIEIDEGLPSVYINGLLKQDLEDLALNEGLTVEDLKAWFKWPKAFSGQIIAWNQNIMYNGE